MAEVARQQRFVNGQFGLWPIGAPWAAHRRNRRRDLE
jgi:hypothetical protein